MMVVAAATGCEVTTPDEASSAAPEELAISQPQEQMHNDFTRAGVTVRLPAGCVPQGIAPGRCQGLQSLRVARIGPLDDLIRPGVHRDGRNEWIGLALVGDSFVFAEANNAAVIAKLFGSATISRA